MGPIIWSCLALTIHQVPGQEYYIDNRGFEIPIRLDPRRAQEVQELILLVSQDKGGVWQRVESKPPSEHKFVYHAPADGPYWFIVQEFDYNGRKIPENPMRAKPSMAIIVDTVPPKVKVTAERLPSGAIRVHWRASDEYPDPRSLRLEYHTSAHKEEQWSSVLPSPVLEGDKEFDPGQNGKTGEVRVRVRMKDRAGNVGEDVAVVAVAGASAEGSPFNLIPAVQADPSGQANQLTSQQRARPPLDPPPQGPNSSSMPASMNAARLPVADSSPRMTPASPNPAGPPSGSPAVKIVKEREVRLDFTVAKVGPSGLGAADVYVTFDKGKTWKKMSPEVSISLPKSADLHGSEPIPGSVSVKLTAEGTIYGFIVSVKSKAGLAPPPPKPGDPPEALVELDTTVPKAQMFRPQPDPSQPNTLILAWTAVDRNLADKPVTLEWAEQKDGPWNIIGEGPLSNTRQDGGEYPWRLPEHLPPRVYLRLTVHDLAGNEARAQTNKPELIDLSVPQTKIIGVAPNAR
ncbi:MAG: hypothetical protein ACRELF_05995 [Gemmataceae bacterium]